MLYSPILDYNTVASKPSYTRVSVQGTVNKVNNNYVNSIQFPFLSTETSITKYHINYFNPFVNIQLKVEPGKVSNFTLANKGIELRVTI